MTLPFWSNLVYQLTHLWHWLAYGQNAAVLGIIGLLVYTWYTRGLLNLALNVRKAEIFPYLVLEKDSPKKEIVIRNVGGPAVHLTMWSRPVSDAFKLQGFFLEANVAFEFGGSLSKLQSIAIAPDSSDVSGARTLYVIDCRDTMAERHQFVLIRDRRTPEVLAVEFQMTNTTRYLPLWRRLRWKLKEWKARKDFKAKIATQI